MGHTLSFSSHKHESNDGNICMGLESSDKCPEKSVVLISINHKMISVLS